MLNSSSKASGIMSTPPSVDPIHEPLASSPKEGQLIHHNGRNYTTIREGKAHILVAHDNPAIDRSGNDLQTQTVFYNPIQQFNRDLSVLAIRAFAEDYLNGQKQKSNRAQIQKDIKRGKKRKRQDSTSKARDGAVEDGETRIVLDSVTDETLSSSQTGTAIATEAQDNKPRPDTTLAQDTSSERLGNAQQISDEDLLSAEKDFQDASCLHNGDNRNARGPRIKILDALSATGLRALRYASELPFETAVTANDVSKKATESMALNVEHSKLGDRITPVTSDAMAHMYSFASFDGSKEYQKYHVVDLDPYGTAVPFIDAAIHAVQNNGLLCITCTDSSIFNSTGYVEKTYSQYGGLPIKGFHSHEGGLRLILHSIATAAARYGVAIEPLLSLSIDFYARVFVRVRRSANEVKMLAGKQMIVYNCDSGCGAWTTQYLARNEVSTGKGGKTFYKHKLIQAPSASQHCEHCGKKTHLSGPMYGGPLHNPAYIEKILSYLPGLDKDVYATIPRIEGMLTTAYDEILDDGHRETGAETHDGEPRLENAAKKENEAGAMVPRMDPAQVDHHPFYFIPSHVANVLRCQVPSDTAIKGALRHAGYRATRSHAKPGTIRTDAPWTFVWKVFREWVKQKAPIKDGALAETSAGHTILNRPQDEAAHEVKVVFDEQLGRDKVSKRLVRYQLNPRANWGPMNRAK